MGKGGVAAPPPISDSRRTRPKSTARLSKLARAAMSAARASSPAVGLSAMNDGQGRLFREAVAVEVEDGPAGQEEPGQAVGLGQPGLGQNERREGGQKGLFHRPLSMVDSAGFYHSRPPAAKLRGRAGDRPDG